MEVIILTSNQIKYAELQETVLHNRNTEGIQRGTLSETSRHNVQDEGIRWYSARNQAYVNTGQLGVAQGQLKVAEAQLYVNGFDTATRRINAITQQGELEVAEKNSVIQRENMLVQDKNASTNRMMAEESIRHNKKTEGQQDYRNKLETVEVVGETARNVTQAQKNMVDSADSVIKWVPGFNKIIGGK